MTYTKKKKSHTLNMYNIYKHMPLDKYKKYTVFMLFLHSFKYCEINVNVKFLQYKSIFNFNVRCD